MAPRVSDLVKSSVRALIPASLFTPAAYLNQWISGDQEPELRQLKRWIRPGSRAIDVGANNGIYAYMMLRARALVEAFEPNPLCVARLKAYAGHHRRLTVHSVALSDSTQGATLFVPIVNGRPNSGLASLTPRPGALPIPGIQTTKLDQFGFSDVSFIKVDVEGHELEVVRGAEATLKHNRPVLQVEIESRHGGSVSEMADYLKRLCGYDGWFFRAAKLVPAARLTPEEQRWGNVPYINNFLFLPANETHSN